MKVLVLTAIYPTPENPAFGAFVVAQVEALKQAGIDVELCPMNRSVRALIYPRGMFQLHKRLARSHVDIVHAHYSLAGMVARTQFKVPVVVTYHGDDLLGSVKDFNGNHWLPGKLIVAAGKILGRTVDAAIVQNRQMAAKLKRKDHVYVVPHEVDFDLFRPIERSHARRVLGLSPNKKYLLFAANPKIYVKRFPLAETVAERLARRDSAVELLTIHKEPQERLVLYMNACDALVFTSFQEGSPNIIKQAMACNLPIVSTDVGDVREVIGTTAGCFICQPEASEFIEKLAIILQKQARTHGREQIRHLDRPHVTARLINIYEETFKKKIKSRRLSSIWRRI